jgi:hypothetical protein
MSKTENQTELKHATSDYRLATTSAVLAEREKELLAIKGHCSNAKCSLHYAHYGPCNER